MGVCICVSVGVCVSVLSVAYMWVWVHAPSYTCRYQKKCHKCLSLGLSTFLFEAGFLLGPGPFIVSSGSKARKSLRSSFSAQSMAIGVSRTPPLLSGCWYPNSSHHNCLACTLKGLCILIGFTFIKGYRKLFNLQVPILSS